MIKLHPSNEYLQQYVEGQLSPAESLVVAAHCELCEHCSETVHELTVFSAEDSLCISSSDSNVDYSSMIAQICALEGNEPRYHYESVTVHPTLEVDGLKFEVPRCLGRFAPDTTKWTKVVGKTWQASVDLGSDISANFIYMEPNANVPEHTHKGNELTLVLNGHFHDGIATYQSGDFVKMNMSNVHAPQTDTDMGCLVFSVIDRPLYFTSGWARLVNPFSHLFFK